MSYHKVGLCNALSLHAKPNESALPIRMPRIKATSSYLLSCRRWLRIKTFFNVENDSARGNSSCGFNSFFGWVCHSTQDKLLQGSNGISVMSIAGRLEKLDQLTNATSPAVLSKLQCTKKPLYIILACMPNMHMKWVDESHFCTSVSKVLGNVHNNRYTTQFGHTLGHQC